jgi:hypothetical protein
MSVAVLPRLQGALSRLAEQGEAIHARQVTLPDGMDEIPAEQRAAWRRVLIGAVNGEGLEERAIGPMLEGLKHAGFDDEAVQRFFTTQGWDELRHRDLFAAYLKRHYSDTDGAPTWGHRLIYDTLFPYLVRTGKRKPLRILLPLLTFERAAGTLYMGRLIAASEGHMPLMNELLKMIRQDEARHVAGVGMTVRALIERHPPDPLERRLLTFAVRAVIADMDRKAWWKPELQAHMRAIGLDSDAMNRDNWEVYAEMKRIIAGRE